MHLKRICTDTDNLYLQAMKLYSESFPIYEQRQPCEQAKIIGNEEYQFNLIYDANELVGIILCWETVSFIYVEHFCIYPKMRNKKYGQQALNLLGKRAKTVILEIDMPIDEVSIRRKRFYERAGYVANTFKHIHPPYNKEYNGHELVVMSSVKALSGIEYNSFNLYLKSIVMKY